jgi:hypothetical protein
VTLESSIHPIGAIGAVVAVAVGAAVQRPVLTVDLRVPAGLGAFRSLSLGHGHGRCPLACPAVAVPLRMATSEFESQTRTENVRL